MSSSGRAASAAAWFREMRGNQVDGEALLLTAEQIHMVCLLAGVASVPGLGPLPIEAGGGGERLMQATAIRALTAWNAVAAGPARPVLHPRLLTLFHGMSQFSVAVRASRTIHAETASRVWTTWHDGAASITLVTPSDYRVERVAHKQVADDIFGFLQVRSPGLDSRVTREGPDASSRTSRSLAVAEALHAGTRIGLVRAAPGKNPIHLRLLTDGRGRWWRVQPNGTDDSGTARQPQMLELSEADLRSSISSLLSC
jgi:hypothetical protein